VTGSFKTASDKDPISSTFKSFKDIKNFHRSRTRESKDLNIGGILKPHYPSKVGSSISAVVAAKSNDLWLKTFHRAHKTSMHDNKSPKINQPNSFKQESLHISRII
jgi:hypothetical protein